jgi:hypothetical protein
LVVDDVEALMVLISGLEVGDKVEVKREEVERGSCSLMRTFVLVCGDCKDAIRDEIQRIP